LTFDATCVERSPASNGRRGTTGKTTLKKKYLALLGRYRRHRNRYRSKVDECLELAVRNVARQSDVDALTMRNTALQTDVDALTMRNTALQSDVDALAAKLSKSRYVFTPPPLVVRCRLY
jgi:hypothetical protein